MYAYPTHRVLCVVSFDREANTKIGASSEVYP